MNALPLWEEAAPRPRWMSAAALFLFLAVFAGLAFRDAASSMAATWIVSSVYHQGLIVLPLSAFLIITRTDWRSFHPAPDWRGVLTIAAACFLWIWARATGIDLFGHAAIVVAIIGAAITAFGRAFAVQSAFPLAFLFFMVPFGEELTPALQGWAAAAVAALLNIAGVETAREGFILTTQAGRFEMAESCAGLRFLIAAAMISALVSYLAFSSARKRMVFIAAATVAAIAANWLRAFAIVVTATVTDRRIGLGPEHVIAGWAFYGALIVALTAIAHHFRDAPKEAHARADAGPQAQSATTRITAAPTAFILILAASFYDGAVISKAVHGAPAIASGEFDTGHGVVKIVAAGADQRDGLLNAEGLRSKAELDWRRAAIGRTRINLAGKDLPLRIETVEDAGGAVRCAAMIYWVEDRLFASRAEASVRMGIRRLRGAGAGAGSLLVSSEPCAGTDPAGAVERLMMDADSVFLWIAEHLDEVNS